MNPTDNVIDLSRFRQRKQAQAQARLMWALYARNAGYQAFHIQAQQPTETRHA